MPARILIADDDEDLCQLLADFLELEGFEVHSVHDGLTALDEATAGHCDLLVLDIMLPGRQGLSVLRELRQHSLLPVVMLTARGDDSDRILGLELGADDYLPKPCNPQELAARIKAVLRRSGAGATPAQAALSVGPLHLDPARREARNGNDTLQLTSTEFDMLRVLMQHVGQVVDKNSLSEQVLRRPLSAYDRSIDVHISNIRKKLGNGADESIRNIRGVGYQLIPPQPDAP